MTREEIEMEIFDLGNQIADLENQILEYQEMLEKGEVEE